MTRRIWGPCRRNPDTNNTQENQSIVQRLCSLMINNEQFSRDKREGIRFRTQTEELPELRKSCFNK